MSHRKTKNLGEVFRLIEVARGIVGVPVVCLDTNRLPAGSTWSARVTVKPIQALLERCAAVRTSQAAGIVESV